MTIYIETRRLSSAGSGSILTAIRQRLAALVAWYGECRENASKRRTLKQMRGMSDHVLRDIGVERLELASFVYHCRAKRRRDHA
jgi:uncharacterized protein YjiS (DUF1127 family)